MTNYQFVREESVGPESDTFWTVNVPVFVSKIVRVSVLLYQGLVLRHILCGGAAKNLRFLFLFLD